MTENERDVFDKMKESTPNKIGVGKGLGASGIVFVYDGTECILKEEPHEVVVSRNVPPRIPSGIFTKVGNDWNFNFADIDKENYKGTVPCCFPLVPENGQKLEEYMDIIIGKPKP